MAEPASKTELSFDEFSTGLEYCVRFASSLRFMAQGFPQLLPGTISDDAAVHHGAKSMASIECFLLHIDGSGSPENRHVDTVNRIVAQAGPEVMIDGQRYASWHEAALECVNRVYRLTCYVAGSSVHSNLTPEAELAMREHVATWDTYKAIRENLDGVAEYLSADSTDWQELSVALRRERWFCEKVLNQEVLKSGSANAADQPAATVAANEHGPDAIDVIPEADVAVATPIPPQVPPYLGLVFNHDSTVSRIGEAYKLIPPIHLSEQKLRLFKFIWEAGDQGRTVNELVPAIVANKKILKTEKDRIDLSEIDIDLGGHGEYLVRCTKEK